MLPVCHKSELVLGYVQQITGRRLALNPAITAGRKCKSDPSVAVGHIERIAIALPRPALCLAEQLKLSPSQRLAVFIYLDKLHSPPRPFILNSRPVVHINRLEAKVRVKGIFPQRHLINCIIQDISLRGFNFLYIISASQA